MVDILKPCQGGVFFYTEDKLDQIKNAFIGFQENTDTKAAMILAFAFQSGQVWPVVATSPLVRPDTPYTTARDRHLSFL